MKKIIDGLEWVKTGIEKVFILFCILSSLVLLLLLGGNVIIRFFPFMSLYWFGEIVELFFAWMVFIGASVLFSRKDHFMIDWLEKKTRNTKVEPWYVISINIICLIFVLTLLVQGSRLTKRAVDWTAVLHLPRRLYYSCMPVSAAFMVFSGVIEIVKSVDRFLFKRKEIG